MKWKQLAVKKREEINKKLEPTYIGKMMVRSTYSLPDITIEKQKPSTTLNEILQTFYRRCSKTSPIGEKFYRFASSVASSFRAYLYSGGFYITVTKSPEGNRHLTMMYYKDSFNQNHAIASIRVECNFFNNSEIKAALLTAINLKSFKSSPLNANNLIPY